MVYRFFFLLEFFFIIILVYGGGGGFVSVNGIISSQWATNESWSDEPTHITLFVQSYFPRAATINN